MPLTPFIDGVARESLRPQFRSRVSSKAKSNGKGKGKAAQWVSEDEDDDDDEAYVTSNDYGTPARYKSANGNTKGRGIVRNGNLENGFQDAAQDDEEELYG